MHPDHLPYTKFMTRANLEKSVNSLIGIIEGISIDGVINDVEAEFLKTWLEGHAALQGHHPFNELMPVVQSALQAHEITHEEREDFFWLRERLCMSGYYDMTTADLQALHAVLGGTTADGIITEEELAALSMWLRGHEHLRTCWPYDEVDSLVTSVMQDGRITDEEHELLMRFFSEFGGLRGERSIQDSLVLEGPSLMGLCAVCPQIEFPGSTFCFTGASSRLRRSQFQKVVEDHGGKFADSMSHKVRYLVIGAGGNPCWAYACYGRKVEQALQMRKSGAAVLLVHENDFHDAIEDHSV